MGTVETVVSPYCLHVVVIRADVVIDESVSNAPLIRVETLSSCGFFHQLIEKVVVGLRIIDIGLWLNERCVFRVPLNEALPLHFDGCIDDRGVLGIFRPKTTKCSGGHAVRGLQRGITFLALHIASHNKSIT